MRFIVRTRTKVRGGQPSIFDRAIAGCTAAYSYPGPRLGIFPVASNAFLAAIASDN